MAVPAAKIDRHLEIQPMSFWKKSKKQNVTTAIDRGIIVDTIDIVTLFNSC